MGDPPLATPLEQSISVAEIRVLRRMSGLTSKDRIRNKYVRSSTDVSSIVDKRELTKIVCDEEERNGNSKSYYKNER